MRLLCYLRLFFGNLDKSFSLGNAHSGMALRSSHRACHLVGTTLAGEAAFDAKQLF